MDETVQVVNNHKVFTADRSQTDLTKVHQRGAWKLKALVRPIYVIVCYVTYFRVTKLNQLCRIISFRMHLAAVLINKLLKVIYQKQVWVLYQGFHTPRDRWKHNIKGAVLLLFCSVRNPWWSMKHKLLIPLLKLFWRSMSVVWFSFVLW